MWIQFLLITAIVILAVFMMRRTGADSHLAIRRLLMGLFVVAAVLALASFALNVGGIAAHPSATFYSPASRAWELLLGAGLACLHARPAFSASRFARVSPNLLAWSGAALEGSLRLTAPFPAGFPPLAAGTVVTIGGQPCTLQAGGPTR